VDAQLYYGLGAHWSDNAWAIGPHETRLALCLEDVCDTDHVMLGNALGDAVMRRVSLSTRL